MPTFEKLKQKTFKEMTAAANREGALFIKLKVEE